MEWRNDQISTTGRKWTENRRSRTPGTRGVCANSEDSLLSYHSQFQLVIINRKYQENLSALEDSTVHAETVNDRGSLGGKSTSNNNGKRAHRTPWCAAKTTLKGELAALKEQASKEEMPQVISLNSVFMNPEEHTKSQISRRKKSEEQTPRERRAENRGDQ